MMLLLGACVYLIGVWRAWRHAGRGRAIRGWQVVSFAAGCACLGVALLSPIDALAEESFAAHMIQHVLLAVVAPPLVVAASPAVACLWALPASTRRRVAGAVTVPAIAAVWRIATTPLIAAGVHAGALWLWHAPRLYTLALEHPAAHVAEHLSFFGTGALLWSGILRPAGSRRTALGVGLVALFATMLQSAALGALITFSRRVWFPAQSAGAAPWHLSPLVDQQLAGLIMWVPGGLLYLIGMSVLFVEWMRLSERRHRVTRAATAAAAFGILGCSHADPRAVPGGNPARGRQAVAAMGCGGCHTIDGVSGADGLVGPPLNGVSRRAIVAGRLPNSPDNMTRWIVDPPAIDSSTAMPNLHVTPQSARDIVAYLYTLR